MKKKKISSNYNKEISLIELFQIIWDGKIIILLTTIFSFLIGFGYSYQLPESYTVKTIVHENDKSNFSKIFHIRNFLKNNRNDNFSLNKKQIEDIQNEINFEIIKKFIYELKDYEEFLLTLKDLKKIQANISNLSENDQEKEMYKYANFFSITKNSKKDNDYTYTLELQWDNIEEAKKILQDTVELTLNNLRFKFIEDLKNNLEYEKELKKKYDDERLIFLYEQSAIAKELNIIESQLSTLTNNNNNMFNFNYNLFDTSYYLRGYKVIDKEINLMNKRDYKSFEYINKMINTLKKDKINWIQFNIHLSEIKSSKNTKLIYKMSILLGLLIGLSYIILFRLFSLNSHIK